MSEVAWNRNPVDSKGKNILCRAPETEVVHVGVFPKVFPHKVSYIQASVQNGTVVDHQMATEVALWKPVLDSQITGEDGQSFFEEELRFDWTQEKRIIVEQYKLFGKIGNAVQIEFDGVGLERRQVFGRNIVLVID